MRIIQLDANGECDVEEREPMHEKLRVLVACEYSGAVRNALNTDGSVQDDAVLLYEQAFTLNRRKNFDQADRIRFNHFIHPASGIYAAQDRGDSHTFTAYTFTFV